MGISGVTRVFRSFIIFFSLANFGIIQYNSLNRDTCLRTRIWGGWNDFSSLLFFPRIRLDKSVIQSYDETNKKVSKESEVTLMSRLPFRPRIAEETKQKIVDLYKNDESLTCEKIARICKVSKSSVFRTLKNSSIDRRGKGRTSVTYYCVEPLRDLLASWITSK